MHVAVWAIAAATIAAIVVRPLRIGEWVWSVLGAGVLVASGLLSPREAARAASDGANVYAFLAGMMLLAELARVHGVFDWLTSTLAVRTGGNTKRLFAWSFAGAVAVTAFLSNDGTILLLTPAALALARGANVEVLPFAYTVAFVANAASFVLPISNPANLVVFSQLPRLLPWFAVFAAPSAVAVACTYLSLRWTQRRDLERPYEPPAQADTLSPAGRFALALVCAGLAIVVAAAALGWPVGYIAAAAGVAAVLVSGTRERSTPMAVVRDAAWPVIPLVAGLFVIVRALDQTGVLELARSVLRHASAMPPVLGRLYAGGAVTLADALINNLPAGVVARYALQGHGVATPISHAVLVGIDLGPNLSISASLATLLWVMMLRREGVKINPWRFLLLGAVVTIPALAFAVIVLR